LVWLLSFSCKENESADRSKKENGWFACIGRAITVKTLLYPVVASKMMLKTAYYTSPWKWRCDFVARGTFADPLISFVAVDSFQCCNAQQSHHNPRHPTQLSGQNETCPALLTVPRNVFEPGVVQPVGLMIGHGNDAEDQRGQLLDTLAVHFAQRGHIVMRYYCRQKEMRRQRIYERTVDTAAFSPYAREVTKWVYCGHSNGARIATLVGYKSPRSKAGFIFLSFPLLDPAPPPPKQKAGAAPPKDSLGPMYKLLDRCKAPQLYICGELDYDCPGADLKAQEVAISAAGVDARAVIISDVDGHFKAPDAEQISEEALSTIVSLVETFLDAVKNDTVAMMDIPRFSDIVPSDRVPPRPVPEQEEEEEEEKLLDQDVIGDGDGDGDGAAVPEAAVAPEQAPAEPMTAPMADAIKAEDKPSEDEMQPAMQAPPSFMPQQVSQSFPNAGVAGSFMLPQHLAHMAFQMPGMPGFGPQQQQQQQQQQQPQFVQEFAGGTTATAANQQEMYQQQLLRFSMLQQQGAAQANAMMMGMMFPMMPQHNAQQFQPQQFQQQQPEQSQDAPSGTTNVQSSK
jgi:dienelactone hydrolase